MKKIWIAMLFLAIIIGFCTSEQVMIRKFCNDMDRLTIISQAEPSEENIRKLCTYWEKENDKIYILCDHNIIDDLSVSIQLLKQAETTEEKKSALMNIKALNDTFYEEQRITFSNIA